jgi:uncharacterized membrane protein
MTPLVLFGLLVAAPIAVTVLLRVNAAILFMSLCVGEVLVQYTTSDTHSFVTTIASSHDDQITNSMVKLALLLLPPILTTLFMFHSIHGSTKAMLNLLPAIGTGLLTALLVKPLLSPTFQHTLEHSSLWHQLSKAQALVVGASALMSLLFLWLQHHSSREHKHRLGHHGKA